MAKTPRPPAPTDREATPRFKKKKREKAASSKKPFASQPTTDEFRAIMDEIDRASDRSSALLAAIYVENFLRFMIRLKFVKLTEQQFDKMCGQGGPLHSFSQIVDLAYALGYLTQTMHNDLHIVRDIRNHFAHTYRVLDFNNPEIAKRAEKLTYVTKEIVVTVEEGNDGVVKRKYKSSGLPFLKTNRAKYVYTCQLIPQYLADRVAAQARKSEK